MSQTTKRALAESLDKITVTVISDYCRVNRMTFYYHFNDIYDLVKWICIQDATTALNGNKTYDTLTINTKYNGSLLLAGILGNNRPIRC